MSKILLGFVIFSLIAIGAVSFAHAELYEDNVTFIKPDNSTISQRGCYWDDPESNGISYNCQWHLDMDKPEEFLEELDKTFEKIVQEIIEENQLSEPKPEPIPKPKPNTVPFFEEMREELAEKCAAGKCTPSEIRLLEVLADTKTFCYDGDNTSVEIQSPGSTIDPHMIFNSTDNYNLHTNFWLGKLSLNEMKCRADETLDNDIHTDFHKNKSFIPFNAKQNLIPAWIANITAANIVEYDTLSPADFENSQEEAQNTICNNHLFGNTYKKQQDCPPDTLYEPTKHSYDYQGLESHLVPMVDIKHNSKWVAYQKYMNSGGQIAEIPFEKKTAHGGPSNYNLSDIANYFGVEPEDLQAFLEGN